jgi:hypothetical protein
MLAYVTGNRVIRLEEISVGEGLVNLFSGGSSNFIAVSDNQFSLRCKEAAVRHVYSLDGFGIDGRFVFLQ